MNDASGRLRSPCSRRSENPTDRSQGLDACLARHAHACTRVTAVRTVRKTGGRRCRRARERERPCKERKEEERGGSSSGGSGSSSTSSDDGGGGGGGNGDEGGRRKRSRRKRAKGGPFVGGYRENEARHRVPHGPFSRHGARQRPQQSGPPSAGARCPGPC